MNKKLWGIFSALGVMIFGMRGGQKDKIVRRAGVPAVIIAFAAFIRFRWKYLAFLLLFPVLSMGYGVDSTLGAWLNHTEWLIRLVYGLLVSIPFLIFGIILWGISAIILVVAFQVHAGSLGHISWFGDILIEDIIRYGSLGLLAVSNILIDEVKK